MMRPIVPVVLLSLLLSSFALIAQEKTAPVVFLENGKQINVAEASGEWTVAGAFMEAEGTGSKLVAGQQLGPGDFAVRAE